MATTYTVLTSETYEAEVDKAMTGGKLGTGRDAKRKHRNLKFATRIPFAVELIQREFGDPITGVIDWSEIPWEDILSFLEGLLELLLKFGLI